MNDGFFTEEDHLRTKKSIKIVEGCNKCGLYRTCNSPKMLATGTGDIPILFLAEAPGEREDQMNTQLIGAAGQCLREHLEELDIDIDKCRKINAVNCRPPDNREPTPNEVSQCHYFVDKELREFQPELVIVLGGTALDSFLQNRHVHTMGLGISKWRGFIIPDAKYKCWMAPTFHPSFVKRMEEAKDYKVISTLFHQDLKNAVSKLGEPIPYHNLDEVKKRVEILDTKNAITFMEWLLDEADNSSDDGIDVSIDYETTGLKPHRPGHDIISVSLGTKEKGSKAFLIHRDVKGFGKLRVLLCKLLRHKKIYLTAHNMKFEEMWSNVILETSVANWNWCSLQAAHVLDNRTGIGKLKLQTYLHFGVDDYSSHIEPYLKSDGKEAGSINNIHKLLGSPALTHDLLMYNGLDTEFQFMLYEKQSSEIYKRNMYTPYDLIHDGALTFSKIELNGIPLDLDKAEMLTERLEKRVQSIKEKLIEYEEVKQWKTINGAKFNLASNTQLANLLYYHLDYRDLPKTATGKPSVDEPSLKTVNLPFVKDLMAMRKLEKIKGTFIAGFLRECCRGKMHPFFNLHTTITYRSSSDSPNFQNIPKRDKEAQRYCRSLIIPNRDQLLVEIDYSQIEVRVAACYHEDPNMIQEIIDPTKDMHGDMAMELYKMDKIAKDPRFCAKNGFVFAQFYGDYYVSCAKALWGFIDTMKLETADGIPMRQNLKSKGIKTYIDFEEHVKEVERVFWKERFPVYDKWRDTWYNDYLEKGWFETLTGFICSGYMQRNDVINYPVQGSAFHCLLRSLCIIDRRISGMKSKLIGQIHDAANLSVSSEPEEFNRVISMCSEIMTQEIPREWDWIIVPLEVEVEAAPMNAPWCDMKKLSNKLCNVCGCEYAYKSEKESTIVYECPICGDEWS